MGLKLQIVPLTPQSCEGHMAQTWVERWYLCSPRWCHICTKQLFLKQLPRGEYRAVSRAPHVLPWEWTPGWGSWHWLTGMCWSEWHETRPAGAGLRRQAGVPNFAFPKVSCFEDLIGSTSEVIQSTSTSSHAQKWVSCELSFSRRARVPSGCPEPSGWKRLPRSQGLAEPGGWEPVGLRRFSARSRPSHRPSQNEVRAAESMRLFMCLIMRSRKSIKILK